MWSSKKSLVCFALVVLFTMTFYLYDNSRYVLPNLRSKPTFLRELPCNNNVPAPDSFAPLKKFPELGNEVNFPKELACYNEAPAVDSFPPLKKFPDYARLASSRNIFFLETSCSSEGLKPRQVCAVESAARANPNMIVNLLILNPSPPSATSRRLADTLLSYANIRINRLVLKDYFANSPAEDWYKSEKINNSSFPVVHMSDMLRILTLWKFGGIYLDLDVINIRSLEDLTDFAGLEVPSVVCNAVLGFSKSDIGRKVANAMIQDIVKNFRGDVWAHNGPLLISRVLQQLCGVETVGSITSTGGCNGFTVFNSSVLYPLSYWKWKTFFNKDDINNTMNLLNGAKIVHFWNALSSSYKVKLGSGVPYDLMAKKHCPKVYEKFVDTM